MWGRTIETNNPSQSLKRPKLLHELMMEKVWNLDGYRKDFIYAWEDGVRKALAPCFISI